MDTMRYQITKAECQEIRNIHEKKLALENLAKILKPDTMGEMYDRVISDYGQIVMQFDDWWTKIFKKYDLPAGHYSVDFENLELQFNPQN